MVMLLGRFLKRFVETLLARLPLAGESTQEGEAFLSACFDQRGEIVTRQHLDPLKLIHISGAIPPLTRHCDQGGTTPMTRE